MNINFVCPCLMGVESLVADELWELGANDVKCENGRVLFSGNFETMARVNICSHFAERILILLARFKATSFEELFEEVKALNWSDFIGKNDAFPVKGSSINSKLKSIPDCQSIIKKAVVEKLKLKYGINHFEETGSKYQIQFLILKDEVSIMIDTTGQPLYKRGYRKNTGIAPIRETLAAAMNRLAHIRVNSTLIDPFCGSGTILIEAAMYALNIAPGLSRKFISETWDSVDQTFFKSVRQYATTQIIRNADFQAYGFDCDDKMLEIASQNAKRAGVANRIHLEKRDIRDFRSNFEQANVICNPPYGERLLDIEKARELYKIIGEKFTSCPGLKYYIISADDNFEKVFGKVADKRRKLYNGMIRCYLYMYFKNNN